MQSRLIAKRFKSMDERRLKVEKTIRNDKTESCSVEGGNCLTSNRMCPGFALLAGYIIGILTTNLTGSETTGFVLGTIVFLILVLGLHSILFRKVLSLFAKN